MHAMPFVITPSSATACDTQPGAAFVVRRPGTRRRAWLAVAACAVAIGLAGCAQPPGNPGSDAARDPISLFPMAAYDQDVDHWIPPSAPDYDRPFLSPEQQHVHFEALFARYFGSDPDAPSPWNSSYIERRVYRQGGIDIADLQRRRISWFDNRMQNARHIGYGENFRPHTEAWIDAIARNMDLNQFTSGAEYHATQRAIAASNLLVRELPTLDPSFYNHRLAGEGYPFDNLQISAVRPGTPLYILGQSRDGAWRYVQTPDVQGWVSSEQVALVDPQFVDMWRAAARRALGVVLVAMAPVRDSQGVFRFGAPAGTLLPLAPSNVGGSEPDQHQILIPARDLDGHAVIRYAQLSDQQLSTAPLSATPRHLALLLKTLIGRPYGWGNSGLYNDCSSELQSIFAVFGVWLPRHSSSQMSAGSTVDLAAASTTQRLDYLTQHGAPMRTLVYIGGHVMLYLGNTTRGQQVVPLVYQDIWGLRPADDSRRAVIGGSVILPLLAQMPEDTTLESLAGKSIFQVSIIGNLQDGTTAPPDEDNPAS